MAPEVLGMSYGLQCDIWSCGVVLFLILSGQQPFKGADNEETFTNIVDGKYSFSDSSWNTISNDAKDMTQKLLTWDENARPTAAVALEHPWITSGGTSRTIKSLREKVTSAKTKVKTKVKGAEAKKEEKLDPLTELKLASCGFIATTILPKGEAKSVEDVFCSITKKNGRLSLDEAKAAFCTVLGIQLIQKQIDQILSNIGADGSNGITFSEFVYGVLDKKGHLTKDSLAKTFEVFGQNSGGIITKQDLKDLLKLDLAMDKKVAKEIVSNIDDDQVSFVDFLSMAGIPPSIVARVGKNSKLEAKKEDPKAESEAESTSEKSVLMSDSDDASDSDADTDDEDDGKSIKSGDSHHTLKLKASSFVSHRLGQLTEHYEIVDYIAKGM